MQELYLKGKPPHAQVKDCNLHGNELNLSLRLHRRNSFKYLSLSGEEGEDADSHMHSHRGVG